MKNTAKYIIALMLIFTSINISAQERTAYNLGGTSFGHEYNPAFNPICKVYVNLPVLSNISLNIRNSFGWFDMVKYNNINDKTQGKTFDFDLLGSVLEENNSFTTRFNTNIIGFGFKLKKLYFHLGSSVVMDARFDYPYDILSIRSGFYDIGTDVPVTMDLSGLQANFNSYFEVALGASYADVIPGLTVGGKLKYLRGIVNLNTVNSQIAISTDPATYFMNAKIDYSIEGSFPADITTANGSTKIESTMGTSSAEIIDFFKNASNPGFAVDLGATYKLNDKFIFGLSVLDLGSIKWKTDVQEMKAEFDYTFDGFQDLDMSKLININKDPAYDNYMSDEIDKVRKEIEDKFNNSLTSTELSSYSDFLPTRIFLSANYQILKWLNAGFLSRNEIYNGKLKPGATLSVNVMPIRQVSASLSYSMMDNTYANIGAGIALRLGPLQLYTITDNILTAFKPQYARNAYVRFGFNLMFGCKPKKEGQSLISQ